MRTSLSNAEKKLSENSSSSKKAAYGEFSKAIDSAYGAKAIPEEKYDAIRGLIDRAETMEEKTALARKFASHFIIGAASAGGLSAGYKALQ
jgi:hypothetical protein